jgi:hypothetical protein
MKCGKQKQSATYAANPEDQLTKALMDQAEPNDS